MRLFRKRALNSEWGDVAHDTIVNILFKEYFTDETLERIADALRERSGNGSVRAHYKLPDQVTLMQIGDRQYRYYSSLIHDKIGGLEKELNVELRTAYARDTKGNCYLQAIRLTPLPAPARI